MSLSAAGGDENFVSARPAESAAIPPVSAPIYSADQVAKRMKQEGWVVRRVAELTRGL